MISAGSISIGILMYSYQIKVVPKYKFLMSQHMYLAPGMEMVLLMMIFYVVMSAISVLTFPA